MRFVALVALAAATVASNALSHGASPMATTDCGALGVLKVDAVSLPAGVDPAAVRKCKEHPLGRTGPHAPASPAGEVEVQGPGAIAKRAQCYFGASYGCNSGFCWTVCDLNGGGKWCWTAWDQGLGAWRTCGSKEDCKPKANAACGGECSCK